LTTCFGPFTGSSSVQLCSATVPYLYIFCQHSGDEQAKDLYREIIAVCSEIHTKHTNTETAAVPCMGDCDHYLWVFRNLMEYHS